MTTRIILVLFASLAWCTACSSSEPTPPASRAKQPDVARQLIASGAVVIDVRSAEEYAEGHLPNAVNIPVHDLKARLDEVAKLVGEDKARSIVVYCAAGGRAAKAKVQLDAAGYEHVVNGGGFDDLR